MTAAFTPEAWSDFFVAEAGAAAALSSYEGAFLLAAVIALASAATIALAIAPRTRALLATR